MKFISLKEINIVRDYLGLDWTTLESVQKTEELCFNSIGRSKCVSSPYSYLLVEMTGKLNRKGAKSGKRMR